MFINIQVAIVNVLCNFHALWTPNLKKHNNKDVRKRTRTHKIQYLDDLVGEAKVVSVVGGLERSLRHKKKKKNTEKQNPPSGGGSEGLFPALEVYGYSELTPYFYR